METTQCKYFFLNIIYFIYLLIKSLSINYMIKGHKPLIKILFINHMIKALLPLMLILVLVTISINAILIYVYYIPFLN